MPVPPDWDVLPRGSSNLLFRLDPATQGSLAQVQGSQLRWGVSVHPSDPVWHFSSEEQPPRASTIMPCPSFEEVQRSFANLGILADLSPPVILQEGEDSSRRSVGLVWTQGQTEHFLWLAQEWGQQEATWGPSVQPSHLAPQLHVSVVPQGSPWETHVGELMLSCAPRVFHPLLALPQAEALHAAEWDRMIALESISGLSTLVGLEALLLQLSQLSGLSSTVSSTVLCAHLLPLVRSVAWQLAPSASAELC